MGLVYQGGYENTALYWVFPFPAIIFGLLGSKVGLQINGLLMLILGVMLYQPHLLVAQYKDAEISRFLASMATVIAVGWINEHFRERSHNAMELLQRSKETQANTDALTHLANRRFVDEVLPQHFALQPEHFFPLAVIIADLDHFKHINDSFGHDQGDLVLQQIAMLFRQKLRTEDIACRYGGEEFLLLLPKTSLKDAMRVADKIRAGIAQRRLLTDHPDLVITCSFGVAMAQNDIEFLQTIKLADQRLYLSKSNGRNQVN
ncbi:MAG: GGDEF domain-containing protein [Gammaproteobacteria bacterium]|nr:GGDEF domain-containing protein [Gammaproteobacteria bacterium]MBU2427786.1 GGDEF domain-containing protein [Gammaproteobacteria bacterium]